MTHCILHISTKFKLVLNGRSCTSPYASENGLAFVGLFSPLWYGPQNDYTIPLVVSFVYAKDMGSYALTISATGRLALSCSALVVTP